MLTDFGQILLFIIAPIAFIAFILGVASLLRVDKPNEEKLTTYESGEDPIGNANIQFNARFYVVALVFLLFEVELLFLFPWAVVFGNEELIEQTNGLWGWFAFAEMLTFIGILVVGLAYAWKKGYLDWVKPRAQVPTVETVVPTSLYEQVNEKYASHKANTLNNSHDTGKS